MNPAAATGESRHLRRLIVATIVAVAVGLATGIAAGYQLADEPALSGFESGTSRFRSPYGSVTAVEGDAVTITSFGRDVVVETSSTTEVTKARAASLADIVEGDTVIVSGTAAGAGRIRADEIVVLPRQWIFLLK